MTKETSHARKLASGWQHWRTLPINLSCNLRSLLDLLRSAVLDGAKSQENAGRDRVHAAGATEIPTRMIRAVVKATRRRS